MNGRGARDVVKVKSASLYNGVCVRLGRVAYSHSKEMYFEDLSFKLDSLTAVSDLCIGGRHIKVFVCVLAEEYSEYHKKLSHSQPYTTEAECNL